MTPRIADSGQRQGILDSVPHPICSTLSASLLVVVAVAVTGCSAPSSRHAASSPLTASAAPAASAPRSGASLQSPAATGGTTGAATPAPAGSADRSGELTIAFAGDVHFSGRTADRLNADPKTAFGESAPMLAQADLTMVNLETAVAVGGQPQSKSFTFQAPPTAFTAMRDAGIDVATMANNHAADYGSAGLSQTLAAIKASRFPVVGIGANAAAAYAPYYTTVHGVRVAILAASQVQDETLANFSATSSSAGIANAYSGQLVQAVRAAKKRADAVIVYVHWGTEYTSCPNNDQQALASTLTTAGATAVIGTHAHVLQGAGWRADGSYVAYGLGNYFWWRSFGNQQDDNGVLTLTVRRDRVAAATFAPAQLDDRGIALPATGANKSRIVAEWVQARHCAGLAAAPPG
jgi:capsule synthesis protein PGA_cap